MKAKRLTILEFEKNHEATYPLSQESIFTSNEWLSLFDGRLKKYGVFKEDVLQAVFALYFRKRYGFGTIENSPLTPHCGLVFEERSGNPASIASSKKEVVEEIASFLDKQPKTLVNIGFPHWHIDLQPFMWRKYKVIVQYTYLIKLNGKTEDDLLFQVSNTRKRHVRNGWKKGLKVEKCLDYKIIENLVAQTFIRQKIRYPYEHVEKVLHQFANPDNSFAYVSWLNLRPIAGCFCIHDRHRAYYLLGGFDYENSLAAAGPMAMFECIKHSLIAGLEYFDFEGSTVPNIERYFRSFGGDLTPGFRVVKASLPIEMALKFTKRNLF